MKRNLFITLLAIFIAGCSHVPLSTMVSMSGFDEEDFIAIKPDEVRVKVRSDKPLDLSDEDIKLQFKLKSPSGNLDENLALNKVSQSSRQIDSWFGEDTTQYSSTFSLSDKSVVSFKKFQDSKLVRTSRENAKMNFNAKVQFPDNTPEQITFSIDLLLNPSDGYFTLIDEYYFDFDEAKKNSQAGE